MITTRVLYMVQDEREIPYMYNPQDCAVCIAGKEIRLMYPGGMKIFVEKVQPAAAPQQASSLEETVKKQGEQLAALAEKLNQLFKKEEINQNDQPKANSTRNAF